MARYPVQLTLPVPSKWGGRRAGAGRKRTPGRRPGVPHRARPEHLAAHPVHVTLRAVTAIRCLRSHRAFPAVRRALSVSSRADFRIVEFSVQADHVHLIAEADHARALATPREVHNALAYVLLNFRRHGHTAGDIDPCSSAPWFRGWRTLRAVDRSAPPPVPTARTWLARIGWRRCNEDVGSEAR